MTTSEPPVSPDPILPVEATEVSVSLEGTLLKASIVGMFLIMLCTALYLAADFLLPVSLAFLFALVLSPIVRTLRRRGVPEGLTAAGLVVGALVLIVSASYSLSGPVSQWMSDAPSMMREVRAKVATLSRSVEAVQSASDEVAEITEEDDPTVQTVVIREPGLLSRAASGAPNLVAKVTLTLILLFFLLASGDMFYEKLVKALPTLSDKKRALRIARDVEREVSRYLFTISVINAGLGVAVAVAMYLTGMPNPALWGVLAALLNYIPYVGAIMGIALVSLVAFVTFDTLAQAIIVPVIYFTLTSIEGQLITPALVGRRLELNAVAVFIAIAFWAWLWGIVGALIAVPVLVTMKVFADNVEGLSAFGQFLAARDTPQVAEPAGEADEARAGPSRIA